MARFTVGVGDLQGLAVLARGVARFAQRLAFAAFLGVAAIASVLARGDFSALDAVVTIVLLAPSAVLLLFAAGLGELLRLPERLRRMPQQGSEQLAELSRIAGEARGARLRRLPLLLWRLRNVVGSTRDLVGVAVPLRVLTPPFLGATLLAALFAFVLVGAGLIALVVLAVG